MNLFGSILGAKNQQLNTTLNPQTTTVDNTGPFGPMVPPTPTPGQSFTTNPFVMTSPPVSKGTYVVMMKDDSVELIEAENIFFKEGFFIFGWDGQDQLFINGEDVRKVVKKTWNNKKYLR